MPLLVNLIVTTESGDAFMLKKRLLPFVLLASACLASPSLYAGWKLDSEQSSVHFVSIKNGTTAETNHFAKLDGSVGDDGKVSVDVHLSSVDSGIQIRDQRMGEMLFETKKMPMASIAANVDVAAFEQMKEGSIANKDVKLTLSLHGKTMDYDARFKIIKLANGGIAVSTEQPLLVKAEDFGLGEGIEALREIAGLSSIATAVPVTVNLVFRTE